MIFNRSRNNPDENSLIDGHVNSASDNISRGSFEDLSIKVRPFDPKEVDWYAYRNFFNSLAEQASWSDRTKTTRLMNALQGSLAGVTAGLPMPITFQSLVARVDSIYGLTNAKEDAGLKLQNCKMEDNESVSLFAERVRQLIMRAYPSYTIRDREEQALRTFLQGLPTKHDMRMHMRMKGFQSLQDAVEFGCRLEQVIKDEKMQDSKKYSARNVTVDSQGCFSL